MNESKLRILLDSISLKSDISKKLLKYSDDELFEFVSLGYSDKHTEAELIRDSEGGISQIIIDKTDKFAVRRCCEHQAFGFLHHDIKALSKQINIKYDDLIIAYLLAALIDENRRTTILVTERKKLLDPQNWQISGFPKKVANRIFSPSDAMVFIDLYCKKKNKYLVGPSFHVNRGFWYLYSLKTKLPNYQRIWSIVVFAEKQLPNGEEIMDITESLGDRMMDMLIAIDEIGKNYYEGVNNDTQDVIIYHFNYWITLFTGVFDSLAWISYYRYQIEFSDHARIGLRKQQKEFRKLLFAKNPVLKTFLIKHSAVLNLMYEPRDLVIHRTRLKGLRFQSDHFYLNMLKVPKVFFDKIAALSKEKGERLEKWGHYKSHDRYFLEPYRFVKKATPMLINFVNEYLGLLDLNEYEKTIPDLENKIRRSDATDTHQKFLQDLDIFSRARLGY